jgi:hypothetical protein
MRAIWKYPLSPLQRQEVEMPALSEILCVQEQSNQVQMWAEVETNGSIEKRIFGVFGTGEPMPSNPKRYIGTVQLGAFLVFHVYEILTT